MADLLTFIDIQTQTQETQKTTSTSNNNSESEPGFFDSLMTEFISTEEIEPAFENLQLSANEFNNNLITFKSGNLFSSSVIEILADMNLPENENSEPSTELLNNFSEADDVKNLFAKLKNSLHEIKNNPGQTEISHNEDDLVLNEEISELLNMSDEELNEKFNSLPEDVKKEVKNLIQEIINTLENGSEDIKSDIAKLSGLLNKNEVKTEIKTSKSKSEKSEPEKEIKIKEKNNENKGQEQKIENNFSDNAGLAVVQNVNVNEKTENHEIKSEKEFLTDKTENQNSDKNIFQNLQRNSRTLTNEINNASEIKTENNNSENAKPENNFNKILENRETSEQNNFSENENQNFNQARENFSENQNSSRSKNNTQKISNENSKTQNEKEFSTSTTSKINSHNNFSNFFEGVLNNRRISTTSPQPLNIRENFNLNRSETLRSGIVNVVRFIRADGVRKANIVIDPPALGRISVELSSTTSGMEASIKVASEQIRQLVQDQLSQLRMNLSEQGVQVAEFTVDVQQDSQQDSRNSQQQNQNDGLNFIGGVEEEDTEEFRVDLEEGLLYWVA